MDMITMYNNELFTDSMVIAEGTGNQHKSVIALIKKYKHDFLTMGRIRFVDLKSLNPQGGRPIKICKLNEPQATLLITYLDNTEVVRKFKMELVHQFYAMRQVLLQKQSSIWQDTRAYAKAIRKQETEIIKSLVDYAIQQGSKNANRYYTSLSKLADLAAGIKEKGRDTAAIQQLNNLSMIENIIKQCIQSGIEQALPYKEIYQSCKDRVNSFQSFTLLARGIPI